MEIILNVPEGQHFASTDSYYDGGFTELTECQDCKAIQDYWGNNSDICFHCGGKLIKNKVGTWDNELKKWLCR